MDAAALPPPGASPSPGGGFPSPAPASGAQGPNQDMQLVLTIVSSSRLLAQKHPGAVPISRQINELAQKLQQVILQSSPQQEPQAPPV